MNSSDELDNMKRKINTPDWANNLTIYEVNLRQYSEGGTFKEFEEHLPRLKELGVGILWFMPIQPIGEKNRKGTLGSYYSINDYTKVNPEFGTLEEFKSLVNIIHDLGIMVIIDWVANHTAWDHHWSKDHPEFYTKDGQGNFKAPVKDWEDVIHLDYGNHDLWDEMIQQMEFWLKETDIDGFRCDMAHLVPTLFWNHARHELDKTKSVFMLAESENHDLLEYAFDTIYNWKLLHAMNNLAAGKINTKELLEIVLNEVKYLPEGASLLNFTSNHDENSWQGSAIERLHYFLEPLTVLTFLLPGIPLIYNGQEAGNYRRLKFFDKDEIEWKEDKMSPFYQKLNELRRKHATPQIGEIKAIKTDAPENILAFTCFTDKNRLIVFLN
ncbi:MAG: alpha-amylase, partial [Bacteroidales bacterium]|nr:alpha-amylase [Bacteroidales bacterium]